MESRSNEKKNEIDAIMKELQDQKIYSIEEAITDIHNYIKAREKVNSEIESHVERVKMMISNFIMELSNKDPDQKLLLELRKKLIEMEEIKIQEKLNFFRDTAELKSELRETMREYREKKSKGSLLDELMKK